MAVHTMKLALFILLAFIVLLELAAWHSEARGQVVVFYEPTITNPPQGVLTNTGTSGFYFLGADSNHWTKIGSMLASNTTPAPWYSNKVFHVTVCMGTLWSTLMTFKGSTAVVEVTFTNSP